MMFNGLWVLENVISPAFLRDYEFRYTKMLENGNHWLVVKYKSELQLIR